MSSSAVSRNPQPRGTRAQQTILTQCNALSPDAPYDLKFSLARRLTWTAASRDIELFDEDRSKATLALSSGHDSAFLRGALFVSLVGVAWGCVCVSRTSACDEHWLGSYAPKALSCVLTLNRLCFSDVKNGGCAGTRMDIGEQPRSEPLYGFLTAPVTSPCFRFIPACY